MKKVKPKQFVTLLKKAKESLSPAISWRVAVHTEKEYAQMQCYASPGGSCVALNGNEILSVCKNAKDSMRGKELVQFAISLGGSKLDSFSGNSEFYKKLGFHILPEETLSFDPQYAPEDWKEEYGREDVLFFSL